MTTAPGADDPMDQFTCTKLLMQHVHHVQQSYNLLPDKQHYGTCINYNDLQESRDQFCEELINTVPDWVYSQAKASQVLDSFLREGRSKMNAQTALLQHCMGKFRDRDSRKVFIQGQFGELLLFNFLQSFFKAVPLLRKMPITTSSTMERFGADAIHYREEAGKNLIFLGEAKTYTSNYQFKSALEKAIASIIETYKKHRQELKLYVYDSFIPEPLQNVAQQYINSALANTEVHLVSIIAYNETKDIAKTNEAQIKKDIIATIEERGKLLEREIFNVIPPELHPRFNYIILPVWKLDELILSFQKKLGK
jgi:hypothetical protein